MMYEPYAQPLYDVLAPILRWLHLVAAMLIVGGALFYEFVLPVALGDLRDEQQRAVFGRVRWMFRWIVLLGAVLLIISGIASTWEIQVRNGYSKGSLWQLSEYTPTGYWWLAHTVLAVIVLAWALRLTFGHRVPPMSQMRVIFVLLLIVVFLATVARLVRLAAGERDLDLLRSRPDILFNDQNIP